jgi:hypothetical protein
MRRRRRRCKAKSEGVGAVTSSAELILIPRSAQAYLDKSFSVSHRGGTIAASLRQSSAIMNGRKVNGKETFE